VREPRLLLKLMLLLVVWVTSQIGVIHRGPQRKFSWRVFMPCRQASLSRPVEKVEMVTLMTTYSSKEPTNYAPFACSKLV
jgi:hypothetical protein